MPISPEKIAELLAKQQRQYSKNKDAIGNRVRRAVSNGTLVRPIECEECGRSNRPIQGHHEDYDKPLDVRWLCTLCHAKYHPCR